MATAIDAPARQQGYVGRRLPRLEDNDLLVGAAQFIDDINRADQVHVCFVRSQVASGRIATVDVAQARAAASVVATITADDLPDSFRIPLRLAPNPKALRALQPALARDVVRYVGEPIVAVLATSRYAAEDAAERVLVEIEPTAVALHAEDATAPAAPLVHADIPSNVVSLRSIVSGDVDAVFEDAEVVVRERLAIQRHTAHPLETRGLLAEHDFAAGVLTVWGATKVKHFNRRALAELLELAPEQLRLVEVAVGGGFGVRGELYPEDLVVPWLALHLGRPVKWVEDRREHFVATNHSREQHAEVEIAGSADGNLLAIRLRAFVDLGAYVRTNAMVLPLNTATHLPGPYRWKAVAAESYGVLTNKTPAGTYRGPGMYEPAFYRERAIDMLARRLEIDPVALRERNLIPRKLLPYSLDAGPDVDPIVYGEGDFAQVWGALFTRVPYQQLRREVGERRNRGEDVGIGTAAFVEAGARGPYEWARIVPESNGTFTVNVGLSAVGQGLRTALSQIAADALGVPIGQVRLSHASTDDIDESAGTFSSRSTVFGSGAVLGAARDLLDKALSAAAERLGLERDEIELLPDAARCRGTAGPGLSFAELGIEGFHRFEKQERTFSMGAALVVASVDRSTCAPTVERCIVAWDVGRAINPAVVEGQLVGAAAQGIGGALLEELSYDESGQPLVTTFLDYALASAVELPSIEVVVLEMATVGADPGATLPIKGAGEAGIIGLGAAVANAVADATASGETDLRQLPLKPELLFRRHGHDCDGT
jgi:CO/xanthine dehydrogenase Mo-binding subunit